jgi:hypothetical protein
MMPRRQRFVIGLTLVVTACGAPHLATVERARASLSGEETTALACIGEPLEQLLGTSPDTSIWRFYSAQPRDEAGRLTRDSAQPPEAHSRACIADAQVQDGRITAVTTTNRADWGMGSIKNCSNLLAACPAER